MTRIFWSDPNATGCWKLGFRHRHEGAEDTRGVSVFRVIPRTYALSIPPSPAAPQAEAAIYLGGRPASTGAPKESRRSALRRARLAAARVETQLHSSGGMQGRKNEPPTRTVRGGVHAPGGLRRPDAAVRTVGGGSMLSQKAKYGLRALVELARADEAQLSAGELSLRAGTPRKFLEAILLELSRNQVVVSRRGKFGGYVLARPASEITFA